MNYYGKVFDERKEVMITILITIGRHGRISLLKFPLYDWALQQYRHSRALQSHAQSCIFPKSQSRQCISPLNQYCVILLNFFFGHQGPSSAHAICPFCTPFSLMLSHLFKRKTWLACNFLVEQIKLLCAYIISFGIVRNMVKNIL